MYVYDGSLRRKLKAEFCQERYLDVDLGSGRRRMLRNTNGLSAASSFPPEQQFEMASYNEPEYFAQAEKTGHIIVRGM